MNVAILFNAPTLSPDHPDAASEADVVAVAGAVAEALSAHGHHARLVPAAPPVAGLVASLTEPRPDVVFNLVEGFAGSSGGEAYLTGLLELLGLPYTGCPPEAQGLCRVKPRAKALLRGAGLPTARFAVVGPGEPVPAWDGPGPVIVKPAAEDASLGIDQGSVATTNAEILAAVDRLRKRHPGEVLVEAYLPGREFNVGLVELGTAIVPLPVAEIAYEVPAGTWPILTYDAKWAEGSAADRNSPPVCPAAIDRALSDQLQSLAVRAFHVTGCRDVARVDFRLDAAGSPQILEVNPNPDIGPTAGWARAVRASGRDWGATLAALVLQARRRADPDG